MTTKIDNINKGHRHRLRQRFLKQGLEGFEEHNFLELLLFYSIPYKDTNRIAHAIMDHFDNKLENVFKADVKELCSVSGVGENTATLIKLVPAISKYYIELKQRDKDSFDSIEAVADFLKDKYLFDETEAFSILSLDSSACFLGFDKLSFGTANISDVSIIKAIQAALSHNASCVVIAHNHPGGNLNPSVSDISATRRLCDAFGTMNIHVMDHVIVSKDGYTSLANTKQYASIFK